MPVRNDVLGAGRGKGKIKRSHWGRRVRTGKLNAVYVTSESVSVLPTGRGRDLVLKGKRTFARLLRWQNACDMWGKVAEHMGVLEWQSEKASKLLRGVSKSEELKRKSSHERPGGKGCQKAARKAVRRASIRQGRRSG